MSDDEDFFVEDEPIEDLQAAWMRGEKGRTTGTRDLNQRAMSIVDRAVARFETDEADSTLTLDARSWFAGADAKSLDAKSLAATDHRDLEAGGREG